MISFSDELAAFRARTADPGYVALILLGTRQATTAALLLGTLDVQRAAFLLTDDTRSLPDEVAALLGVSADAWLCPEGDHSTTLAVYQGLRQVLDSWGDLDCASIGVDVTGGLKPMSVGVEKAAHVLGLHTIYIQSGYGKLPDGRFGPVAGTQQLIIPPDPYTVFGDLEAAEARRQYYHHEYAVAAQLYRELAGRMGAPELAAHKQQYTALAELSDMYAAWDVLDFAGALIHADALLVLPLHMLAELAPHAALLTEQRDALIALDAVARSVVGRGEDAVRTLASADAMLPLLGTLHANALRRAAQGRYDFAALFRYRCLELLMQHRLATYGLLSNAPNYKGLPFPKAELSARFQAVQKQLGRKQPKGLPDRITLFDGYMLLAALDDPLVRGYPIAQIEARSQARNTSVLAHGYRLIGRDEYAQFAAVVDQIIDRLFDAVLRRPRAAWEHGAQFIDLGEG